MPVPDHTLSVSRMLAAPRTAVWRCWTEGDLLRRWFTPAPWTVSGADLDPRPGGRMNVVMAGPDGARVEAVGCYLEVVPGERLVFTDAFAEGFMPRAEPFVTSAVTLSDADGGTRIVWSARHGTPEAKARHVEMGMERGWAAALDQLDVLARGLLDEMAHRETADGA